MIFYNRKARIMKSNLDNVYKIQVGSLYMHMNIDASQCEIIEQWLDKDETVFKSLKDAKKALKSFTDLLEYKDKPKTNWVEV